MEGYIKLLSAALEDLSMAIDAVTQDTDPATPPPRPRLFLLAEGVSWPRRDQDGKWRWDEIRCGDHAHVVRWYPGETGRHICYGACGGQPRKVLRALRRIQAATAWCLARAEGRKRAAQEILRQQAGAVEALEAEIALRTLAE